MVIPRTDLRAGWQWLVIFLFVPALAAAAVSTNVQWFTRHWQSDEGLPDNTVVDVAQGGDGFLWVATRSGLARFDGVQFREIAAVTAAGAPTAVLYALCLDRSNRLWVAKDRGVVVRVALGRTSALTPEDGLPVLPVRMMVEDREGAVWISYLDTGGVVRISGDQVQSFTSQDGLPGSGTCQLASDRNGQIWFAQSGRVGVFRGGKFVVLQSIQGQRIAAARAGGIWIYGLTQQQLFNYEEGRELVSLGKLPVERANVDATVIYEDRTGAVWVGTRQSGLFRYDGKRFTPVQTSHYEIRSIMEDQEGNLWVGTEGGGLNRIQPRTLELVDVGSGIVSEAVRSVSQDTAGVLWAVTASGVVVRNRGDGWTNEATLNAPIAQCVAADPNGGIWVGTQYLSLFSWRDGVAVQYPKAKGLAAQSVRSLLVTSSGAVWIGTESSNALQRLHADKLQTFPLPEGSGFITAMALDGRSNLWAGTSGGLLLRCDGTKLTEETANTLAPPEAIRSLCATPDGNLWIGYGGRGLGRLNDTEFVQFGTEQGLHDDYISHIAADSQGRLWFAGNRGIFYVPRIEFDEVAAGQRARLRSIVYGSDEGLPNLQASYGFLPGALIATNGDLLVPTLTGLASVKVDRLQQPRKEPPVVITRVLVDGHLVAAYQVGDLKSGADSSGIIELGQSRPRVRLSPEHQRVEIEFTALNFTAPRNVSFKYQLEGLDRDWVEVGSKREALYTHILAGDYTFRVKACNEWGQWSEPGVQFSIRVLPYYWQTWTFRIAASIVACALVAGSVAWVVRQRHRRRIEQLERQRAMDRERARIAQDLHDDLGSGLTEISFGSEFAQDPALGLVETRQYTQEMGSRARELVAALDEIVWAVNPKNDTVVSLASYLCQYAERFLKPTRLRLRLKVARDLPPAPLNAEERHNLFLAFKEALHNVVQHSKATDVQLAIGLDDADLTVVVGDNGSGFDPNTAQSEADGLGNMRRRLERIGGSYELVSLIGKGTTATFRFPLPGARAGRRQ
jgi:ligand-binding sensor domain-containing protein/signal transduction histidine kinase